MSKPLPEPEFKGFTIQQFTSYLEISEDKHALHMKEYYPEEITLEYDAAKWIYRFFLKVRYTGDWSPYIFAIFYRGKTRDEDTPIMALVPPIIGTKEPLKILSSDFDQKPERCMKDYRNQMQQQNPDKKPPYHYGFLQLDYHHSETWYQPGTCTIEVKLGTGHQKEHVDRWSDPQKYHWIIPKYTPPYRTKNLKGK